MVSWFSSASVVRLPAEFRGVGLGFTAPVTEEGGGGGVACTWVIPMTACLKIVACRHAEQVSGGSEGVNRAACGILFALSLMLWIKVPVLPVKNEITLTGGGLSKLLTVCHIFTALVVRLNCGCRQAVEANSCWSFVFLTSDSDAQWFIWGENNISFMKQIISKKQVNFWDLGKRVFPSTSYSYSTIFKSKILYFLTPL